MSRHLTDIQSETLDKSVRAWFADDTATEAQKDRLDDYIRAGIMDRAQAIEVRYKWFRKGCFTEAADWTKWTRMIEEQEAEAWDAYRKKQQ
jgi:hypothetical protein